MQDLDVNEITEAVIAQMADTPDPRLREIMEAAVRHLHAFAREVRLTPDEWLQGIAFLTAVGQACSPGMRLAGTARSSTGNNGLPSRRSSTNTKPCLLTCASAGTRCPSGPRHSNNTGCAGVS